MSKGKYEQIDLCDYDNVCWDEAFIWDESKKIAQSSDWQLIKSNGNSAASDWHAIKYNGKSPEKTRLIIYSAHNVLGEGVYGRVYAGKKYALDYKLQQITFKKDKAVKVVIATPELQNEFLLSRKIKHLGVKDPVYIQLAHHDKVLAYLPMNQIPGESLSDLIVKNICSNYVKLELTYLLLKALREQVTSCGVIHRDIKPQNILVKLGTVTSVYIIDYGFATEIDSPTTALCGTPNYIAPELFGSVPPTPACDVHSMAKTIIYLWLEGKYFYDAKRKMVQRSDIENFTNDLLSYLQDIPEDLVSLLKSMLEFDPDKRIKIDQAITEFELAFPLEDRVVDSLLIYLEQLKATAACIKEQSADDAEIVYACVNQMKDVLRNETDLLAIKDCFFNLLQNGPIASCAKRHVQVGRVVKSLVVDSCDFLIDNSGASDIKDYQNKGTLHGNKGEWYQAFYYFYQALRPTTSSSWELYHKIADVAQNLEWYNEAIRAYDNVLVLNPHCVTTYQNRGTSYVWMGEYSKAIDDFSRANQLNPSNKSLHYSMAVAYSHLNLYFNAVNSYVEAIKLGFEPCQSNFQWFLITVKRLPMADLIIFLKQCLNPATSLGCLYAKHNEEREAIRSYLNELQPAAPGANFLFFNTNEQSVRTSVDSQCAAPPAESRISRPR